MMILLNIKLPNFIIDSGNSSIYICRLEELPINIMQIVTKVKFALFFIINNKLIKDFFIIKE